MAGSSEKVNYNIRTCKSIERKMMCDMIACLEHVAVVANYRYVGLGAKYFTDFVLMHKQFGITEMYSLETRRSENEKERFLFNRPLNCINIEFQSTTEWLNSNKFRWKEKNDIIWFDYDGPFSINQVSDIGLCVKKVISGSAIFVSTNASFVNDFRELQPKDRLEKYTEMVGDENYTKHLNVKNFAGDKIYSVIANTFNVAVQNGIAERNQVIENESKRLNAKQIVFFNYADSITPMITLGWIIYNNYDEEEIKKCGFEKFDFYRAEGDSPFLIDVPPLTFKELSILNKNMPECQYPIEEAPFFTKEEVDGYKKIYRYYPTTIETGIVL